MTRIFQMLRKPSEPLNQQGQTTIEGILVIGVILVPLMIAALHWVRIEWNRCEKAFQDFKQARIRMIRTERRADLQGLEILPLEDLDRDKGALKPGDLLKEASRLLDSLSSS